MHRDIVKSRERISRRRALGLGGAIGLGGLFAAYGLETGEARQLDAATARSIKNNAATDSDLDLISKLDSIGACTLTEAEMQGPFWFNVDSIRSDIREDRPGTNLELALRVYDQNCEPIPNSVVEIWHCDAGGIYSGYEVSSSGGGMPMWPQRTQLSDGVYSKGARESMPEDDATYLRGAQVADENGIVQFNTIYPGWYRGRAVHVHVKVHLDKRNVLTTQLYFDDAVTDEIYRSEPYSARPDRDTRNARDTILHESNIIPIEPKGDGYSAYANLAVRVV